jgi:hypothetical protein
MHNAESLHVHLMDARIFGFVSRKPGAKAGNECHIMADYEPEHPATDIVQFLQKTMVGMSHS